MGELLAQRLAAGVGECGFCVCELFRRQSRALQGVTSDVTFRGNFQRPLIFDGVGFTFEVFTDSATVLFVAGYPI